MSQALKSDPRENPVDQSAIPLIALLIPKHPESGCFVDWFLGMSNVSFDGVGEISTELREGIVYYIQRKGMLACIRDAL